MPAAPTGVTVVAGNSSIKVSWTASVSNGTPITGYQATASPGPATCSTTGATSCVLGGVAATWYKVTVVALSAGGPSKASEPSATVVPSAPAVSATPPDTKLPLDTGDGAISTVLPGQEVVMIGSGYAPFSTVLITVYSTPIELGTVTTDSDGGFRQSVRVPGDLPAGAHSFVAAGVDENGLFRAMRLDVTVAAAGDTTGTSPGTGSLPVTGTAVVWMILAGFAVTLVGAVVRAVWR